MAWIQSDVIWNPPFTVPSWSEGTDEEIVKALEKHYNNEIDLTEYWSVGDERTVNLKAMSVYPPLTEAHDAQTITLVILNVGGKELVTPIKGHTECAFIVGQKNCLATTGLFDNPAKSSGWYSSDRRSWCNNAYRNAIPFTLRSIFKLHNNYVSDKFNASSPTKSEDYFCFPSEKEVTGSVTYARASAEANNSLLSYYETSTNRIKYLGETNTAQRYWTSSKYYKTSWSSTSPYSLFINVTGDATYSTTQNYGLAPQGVI